MSMALPADPLAGLRGTIFTGRDSDHLASVDVDADGVVLRVRLATTVGLHPVAAIERAVRSAIDAAQFQLAQAWQRLAEQATEEAEQAAAAEEAEHTVEAQP
jgi:hypothetical protein